MVNVNGSSQIGYGAAATIPLVSSASLVELALPVIQLQALRQVSRALVVAPMTGSLLVIAQMVIIVFLH